MDSVVDRRIIPVSSDRPGASQISDLAGADFRIEQFLLGPSRAHGLFQDFTGKIRRRFAIDLEGKLEDGALVLREDFLFDDGETEQRIWRISPVDEAGYIAHAGEMIGEARGRLSGGVLKWAYRFSLKIGEHRLRVRFHDTFVRIASDVLLNTARITLFGFEIGRTTIVFRRIP